MNYCTNCKNTQNTTQTQEESDDLAEASIEEIIADGPSSENIEEIMDWVFGDYSFESEGGEDSSNEY